MLAEDGGASSEGEGGAGAGYAFFPIFIQSGNSIYFYVGSGGRSSSSGIVINGHDGDDTIFWEGSPTLTKDNYTSARIFAYIERGHGGHDANRSTESDRAYGGGVAIYSGVAKNIRKNDKEFNTSEAASGYKYITSAVALNNIYKTPSDFIAVLESNKGKEALQKRSTNGSVFIVNGCCGGNGNASTSANGDSITVNLEKKADYAQIYNKSSWTNNGGTGKSGGGFNNDKSSGGGACAFPGSFAGDGGDPGTTDTLLRSWTNWNLWSRRWQWIIL